MTPTEDTPDLFELKGNGTEISYSITSIDGSSQLSYTGPHGENVFSGDQIETARTALGTEITVALSVVPDKDRLTLTLVLPDHVSREPFSTLAVVTRNSTPFAGAMAATPQTYEMLALDGVARFVES